jgi:hypothetical protein
MGRDKFINERKSFVEPTSRRRLASDSRSRSPSRRRSVSRRSPSRRRSPTRRRSNTHRPRSRSRSRRSGSNGRDVLDTKTFQDIISRQQERIEELLDDQRHELEDRIDTKSIFKDKRNEKQHSFNSKVLKCVKTVKSFLKSRDSVKALDELYNAQDLLHQQNEDLIIADSSKFGWLTVAKLRGKEQLSTSIQKKIAKIETNLDRNNVKTGFKKGGGPHFKRTDFKSKVETSRPAKKGPEETLRFLKSRKRSGVCTFCSENGHFWRECPGYWSSVKEARNEDN